MASIYLRSVRAVLVQIVGICFAMQSATAQATLPDRKNDKAASLSGSVMSERGERPLAGAEVGIADQNASVRTDSLGQFRLSDIPAGSHVVTVRLIGFEPYQGRIVLHPFEQLEADFFLRGTATELAKVEVKGSLRSSRLEDFEGRRRTGIGRFLTGDVFEQNKLRNVSEILTSAIPGVRTIGNGGKQVLVGRRNGESACRTQVVLNGISVFNGQVGQDQFDVNSIRASDILGVEFYTVATTPSQFNGTAGSPSPATGYRGGAFCGTIAIWTR